MKAIIVDDERHVLEGLRKMIPWEQLGIHRLEFADNGESAWQLFRQDPPDIVMTDMNMKGMNGIELVRRIRGVDPDIPIVVLSGYDDFAYTKTAIELDVTRYILKPSMAGEIEREIRDVLTETRQKQREKSKLLDVKRQFEHSVPILREQLLDQIVSSSMRREGLTGDKLSFYGLSPQVFDGGLLLSVHIYRSSRAETQEERQWQLFKFAVSNIVGELLAEEEGGYLLRYVDNRLPILLTGGKPDLLAARADKLGRRIVEAVQSYLRIDLNIGIGRYYPEASRYVLSLKEAAEAAELGELEGMNQVLAYSEEMSEYRQQVRFPAVQVQQLGEALVTMDRAAVHSIWLDICRTLTEGKYASLAHLHTVCTGILSNLALKLMEHDSKLMQAEYASDMLLGLHRHRVLEELIGWMSDRIDDMYARIAERHHDQGSPSYVEAVKNAVSERYAGKISFAALARELNLSRNYLSNLFKKETGVSFIAYLGDYRIGKAKALLLKKRYSVYEIAGMVGYQDAAYFSRAFKQATGHSPLEYVMSRQE